MTADELCASLGIEPAELEGWLAAGLPYEGPDDDPTFDPAAASQWLVEQGLAEGAEEPDLVFETQQEAAHWFGVTHDTLARGWRSRGMPGEPGAYSAREIAQWLAHRYGLGTADHEAGSAKRAAVIRKLEAEAATKELRLLLQQKQLCRRNQVRLEFCEVATRARDILMRIPADLRPFLPQEHADQIVSEVDRAVRAALELLARRLKQIPEESLAGPDGELARELG